MSTSTAYAELGGGLSGSQRPAPSIERGVHWLHTPSEHRHEFHPESGWCGCGQRDTGQLAEGSPAWRAARSVA